MRLDLTALNEAQLEAVVAGDGPLLVLAGAGTGKTRVITYRLAHLMRSGVSGDRLLGITFTNKAAREMRERLRRMYPDLDPAPTLSTFHSLGYRMLREEHQRLEFRANFPIYDESDVGSVLTEVMRELAGMRKAESGKELARSRISRWKSRFVAPEDALDEAGDDDDYLFARAYARYQERLDGLNAVDFDDLIYLPVRLMETDDEMRAKWTCRYDHVLVDEYQDTNTAQYRFARLLAGERENICVVGDDDQSIYAFRGAEVEKILSFRRDFPGATVITLEDNYRSVGTILDAANAVIDHNTGRHEKRLRSVRGAGEVIPFLTLEDETTEAEEVIARVMSARRAGLPYGEQAILMRSAIQARPFEEKLRFFQIPYTIVGGRSFFDRREVRDMLAYMRLLVTPEDDIAMLRILNTPRRGWGAGNREKLDGWAREHGVPVVEALRRIDDVPGITSTARDGARGLIQALDRATPCVATDASAATRALLEEVSFDVALRERTQDTLELDARRRSANSLVEGLAEFEKREGSGALREYLDGISLERQDDKEESGDSLTLLTFHGAKGLEYRNVHLVGIEDGIIPHRRSLEEDEDRGLEEERRLFYVAITRARDHLTLTRTAKRNYFGKEVDTVESRFALEIPDTLIERRDVFPDDEEPVDEETAANFLEDLRSRFSEA